MLTIVVYLVALPFLLFAGFGFIIFFVATAWLLGREYFELAAMRFRPVAEAKAMRKHHAMTVFVAGLLHRGLRVDSDRQSGNAACSAMAFMVHMHKQLSARDQTALSRPQRVPMA